MTLGYDDWNEIQQMMNRMLAQQGGYFVQGKVVKSNSADKLIWLKEFGDQPIPLVGFDMQVKYYYEDHLGVVQTRKTKAHSKEVEILTPQVGDVVLIACHMGSRRLPKCLGVIQSTNYVGE